MPTYTELMRGFDYGPWSVLPDRGLIRNGDDERRVEPLVMDVLVALVSHGGEVVSRDQLIEEVWDGRPQMDDVINRCIKELRRALGDNARAPKYVETVHRRGYRAMLRAAIPEADVIDAEPVSSVRSYRWPIVAGVGLLVAVAAWRLLLAPAADDKVPSIAVYPFDCVQGAGQLDDYLCFGFPEEAITSLKRLPDLTVVRIRSEDDPYVAVDTDYMVRGSVQIVGDQVKTAVRLESVRDGVVRMSESFDNDKDRIFDLQRQVGDALATALYSNYRTTFAEVREPANREAADAYNLGRYYFRNRDHRYISQAIEQFEKATDADPSYGPAWLGLGYTYIIWPDYDLSVDRQTTYDSLLDIMARGIAADPGIRDAAGSIYGFIYHKRNRWADALRETTRAVNAKTATADDFNWHSRILASVGRLDEALEFARRGLELDPQYKVIVSRMAIASLWVDDLDTAGHYFDIANRMELDASIHLLVYSLYLMRRGQYEEAKQWAREGLERNGIESDWVGPVIDGIRSPDDRPLAVATLEQIDADPQRSLPDNIMLTLWVMLGENDRAMKIARQTERTGGLFEQEIIFIDEFREFRQHPQFMDFVKGVGLADYWAEAGCEWRNDRVTCSD